MKVLAVTGGAQGIGRAIAQHFAAQGYAVSIADPDEAAGAETVQRLQAAGAQALYLPTDVSQAGQVEAWLERTAQALGCPDVLVNNAGISRNAPFLELAAEDFDRVLAVNLRGTYLCSQAAARRMVQRTTESIGRRTAESTGQRTTQSTEQRTSEGTGQGTAQSVVKGAAPRPAQRTAESTAQRGRGGAIVNIGSTRAHMSEPGTEAYSASKGGIAALTHALAVSLGPHGIRVNCIHPGWIETRDWKAASRSRTPVHSERDRLQHPVGRVGRPEDVAEACWFLAEHAGFMTGQEMTLDGGMTVKMIYEA